MLATFKSSYTISRAEDFSRSARFFASCFKKMTKFKMKEKKSNTVLNGGQKVEISFLFGDLEIEVATDIENRIGQV